MSRPTTPPQHGERRCYLRGCRCPKCVAANTRYSKASDLRRQRTGPRRIDAQPAAKHLRALIAQGWSQYAIAQAANLSIHTVQGITSGTNKFTTPEDLRSILAFRPDFDDDRPGYWTDATGSGRRLRALAVLGHTLYAISEATELCYASVRRIARGETKQVSKAWAQRLAAVYEDLRHQDGPSPVTRGMARSFGWLGPDAWECIDDPQARPAGETSRQELADYRRSEIERLNSYGIPEGEIAERLQMAAAYVHDIVRELHTGQRRERAPRTEVAA